MGIYFSGIPGIGDLYDEYVFYEYGEPVLFVCTDKSGSRYLCSCSRLSEQWLVGKVTNEQLLNIIDKKLAIDEAFRACTVLICIRWDGKELSFREAIPDDAFPKKNSFLRLSKERTYDYRCQVEISFHQDTFYQVVTSFINSCTQEEYLQTLMKILADTDVKAGGSSQTFEEKTNIGDIQSTKTDNTSFLFAA